MTGSVAPVNTTLVFPLLQTPVSRLLTPDANRYYCAKPTHIMASGFFALLDDIATLMDDVATMSKVATKKTAGILGDDLAVNAEKATGFISSRELPVLWAISKASFLNKLIILPLAFLMSFFAPWLIGPILLAGGAFLAYEGVEKIFEYAFPHKREKASPEELTEQLENLSKKEILAHEKKKVKSAVFVDFILSVEIVIIALSTVVEEPLKVQIMVVSVVAMLATVGVYGIVALIVRMDDFGLKLTARKHKTAKVIGKLLIQALPVVIKTLGVVGTAALILVAGGIYTHYMHIIEKWLHGWPSLLADIVAGLAIGLIIFGLITAAKRIFRKKTSPDE